MSKELQEAIDNLSIRDVYLYSSYCKVDDNFEPKFEDGNNIENEFKHYVTQSQILEVEEDDGSKSKLFRVFVELGARFIRQGEVKEEQSSDDSTTDTLAIIEATFVSEYRVKKDISEESMKTFSLKNASYHIWPYWREYLMTQCNRMNLPKIAAPMIQLAQNGES